MPNDGVRTTIYQLVYLDSVLLNSFIDLIFDEDNVSPHHRLEEKPTVGGEKRAALDSLAPDRQANVFDHTVGQARPRPMFSIQEDDTKIHSDSENRYAGRLEQLPRADLSSLVFQSQRTSQRVLSLGRCTLYQSSTHRAPSLDI